MRAQEFTTEMAGSIHVGISQYLANKGYQYLGGGIDKQAFLEPDTGQVLIVVGYRKGYKDFSPDQRMFIDWINYCNKNQDNPHLPRFSGFESFTFHGKNYIQARMEVLQELPREVGYLLAMIQDVTKQIGNGNFNAAYKKIVAWAQHASHEEGHSEWYDVQRAIELLGGRKLAKSLLQTVHEVSKFGKKHGFRIDLHKGNYMKRADGTIIVNDPYVLFINDNSNLDEANIIDATTKIDVYLKGKHNKQDVTKLVARNFPNNKLPALIQYLVDTYKINPKTIVYGPSAELDEDMTRRGFLGALGAGAMAAAGVPAQAGNVGPPMLSGNIGAEEALHKAARAAGIKGVELAQFLAQCYHESAGFMHMQEIGNPKYFLRYDPRVDPQKAKVLGNTQPGDGERYKGRGFIQITGRDNYRRAGEALGLPLEQRPELASRPDVAAQIAIWYWKQRVRPNVQNFNDTRAVTKQINPNMRGLQDRHENFKDYKSVFSI